MVEGLVSPRERWVCRGKVNLEVELVVDEATGR